MIVNGITKQNIGESEQIYKGEARYLYPDCTIRILADRNPKRQDPRKRFALYKDGQTIADYCDSVARSQLAKDDNPYLALEDLVWDFNYGFIDIFPPSITEPKATLNNPTDVAVASEIVIDLPGSVGDINSFDPTNILDGRHRIISTIVARRGQQLFRSSLIEAYGARCAMTGCDICDILDAAHISPYLGLETNDITNGILLRTDIHTLFDLGFLTISSDNYVICVHESILSGE